MSKLSAIRRMIGGVLRGAEKSSSARAKLALAPDAELPMSVAARRARAIEQGYDVERPLYHGRVRDTTGPAPRPSLSGALGEGVYLSPDPEIANAYAALSGVPKDGSSGRNVIKAFARGKFASKQQLDELTEKLLRKHKGDEFEARRAAIEELKRQRYVGVRDDATNYVTVFDPANLRSPNARFDPRPQERARADLLAGLGGVSVVGAAARTNNAAPVSAVDRGRK